MNHPRGKTGPKLSTNAQEAEALVHAWRPVLDFFAPACRTDAEADALLDFLLPSKYVVLGALDDTLLGIRTVTLFFNDAFTHWYEHHKSLEFLSSRGFKLRIAEANAEEEAKVRAEMKCALS